MITDKDIKKLITAFLPIFATKEDFNNLKFALKEDMTNLRSDVYTKMDQVYKEVVAVKEEQAGHLQEHENINSRLTAVESVPVIAHELKSKKK